MKLLLDEMLNPRVARQLRVRGHDVIAVVERDDLRGQDDSVILAVAAEEGRVVVTEDRSDYRRLASAGVGPPYPSIVLVSPRAWRRRNRLIVGRLVNALDALLRSDATIEGEHWLTPVD